MVNKMKPAENLEQNHRAVGKKPVSCLPPQLSHSGTLGISVSLTGAFVSSSSQGCCKKSTVLRVNHMPSRVPVYSRCLIIGSPKQTTKTVVYREELQ